MTAYVIAEIEVTNPDRYAEYRKQVPATIEKYGGRFVVRGGDAEGLEGGWQPERVIVVAFPSRQEAMKWYRSADYAPLIALRQSASRGKLCVVDGL